MKFWKMNKAIAIIAILTITISVFTFMQYQGHSTSERIFTQTIDPKSS